MIENLESDKYYITICGLKVFVKQFKPDIFIGIVLNPDGSLNTQMEYNLHGKTLVELYRGYDILEEHKERRTGKGYVNIYANKDKITYGGVAETLEKSIAGTINVATKNIARAKIEWIEGQFDE